MPRRSETSAPDWAAWAQRDNYGWISDPGLAVIVFLMLVGRLEIYTVLLLFHPDTWKRQRAQGLSEAQAGRRRKEGRKGRKEEGRKEGTSPQQVELAAVLDYEGPVDRTQALQRLHRVVDDEKTGAGTGNVQPSEPKVSTPVLVPIVVLDE